MTPTIDDKTLDGAREAGANEYAVEATPRAALPEERGETASPHARLLWIGALANPHLGHMLVVGDGGYLVPVWTAGELLRGCKYFWRRSQE